MILQDLAKRGLINPPNFVLTNTAYLSIMGSNAYGVADTSVKDKIPDFDIYGFCIPPKDYIFPHLRGEIPGFGTVGPTFEQWQQAHIHDASGNAGLGREWDFQVFSIVKMFQLCMENNPNMIDSLFTPENCVIHSTEVGRLVRDNRKLFLSKLAWKKFRGYAWSQMHKMKTKSYAKIKQFEMEKGLNWPDGYSIISKCERTQMHYDQTVEFEKALTHYANEEVYWMNKPKTWKERIFGKGKFKMDLPQYPNNFPFFTKPLASHELKEYLSSLKQIEVEGNRAEIVAKHGYDVKFAYHLIRLLDEAEQIMLEGDINLQRAKEPMKAIRRGEWKEEDIYAWAQEKDKALEAVYSTCKLPEKPSEEKIKALLMQCLEAHYGSIQGFEEKDWSVLKLKEIDSILSTVRNRIYG